MEYDHFVELVGRVIEIIGVGVIVLGAIIATAMFVKSRLTSVPLESGYKRYRQNLGRSILLGLEFLVAGDIIRSIALPSTFSSVGVLAIIVLIRSFLAIELEMEINGRWPWQENSPKANKK